MLDTLAGMLYLGILLVLVVVGAVGEKNYRRKRRRDAVQEELRRLERDYPHDRWHR
jgi:hypothetical protein